MGFRLLCPFSHYLSRIFCNSLGFCFSETVNCDIPFVFETCSKFHVPASSRSFIQIGFGLSYRFIFIIKKLCRINQAEVPTPFTGGELIVEVLGGSVFSLFSCYRGNAIRRALSRRR